MDTFDVVASSRMPQTWAPPAPRHLVAASSRQSPETPQSSQTLRVESLWDMTILREDLHLFFNTCAGCTS